MKAPLSIHIFGMIWRNVLIFAHNMALYVLIAIVFALYPTWATLLVIPGLFLVCLNALWIGMLLGTLCTRFRDIPPIVTTVMQMMFLLTPILWRPDQVPGREAVSRLNPFYYFVELIREPLLDRPGSPDIWAVAILITLGGLAVALPLYGRFRDRIVYWL
jgi:ABC-2 type transport system permease protein